MFVMSAASSRALCASLERPLNVSLPEHGNVFGRTLLLEDVPGEGNGLLREEVCC